MFGGKCLNKAMLINIDQTVKKIVKVFSTEFRFFIIMIGSQAGQNYLTMMFFNDKVSPANISFLTRYGLVI